MSGDQFKELIATSLPYPAATDLTSYTMEDYHAVFEPVVVTFEEAVQGIPEVMECYLMTGEFDYLLRVIVSDPADYERIHRHHLTRLPAVSRVQSSFALRTVRKTTVLPLR